MAVGALFTLGEARNPFPNGENKLNAFDAGNWASNAPFSSRKSRPPFASSWGMSGVTFSDAGVGDGDGVGAAVGVASCETTGFTEGPVEGEPHAATSSPRTLTTTTRRIMAAMLRPMCRVVEVLGDHRCQLTHDGGAAEEDPELAVVAERLRGEVLRAHERHLCARPRV